MWSDNKNHRMSLRCEFTPLLSHSASLPPWLTSTRACLYLFCRLSLLYTPTMLQFWQDVSISTFKMILNSRWKLKLKMLDLTDTLWLSCCGSNAWNCGRRYRRINQSQKRKRDFHPEVWYWGRNYRNIKQLRNGRKIHPSKFRFGLRRRKLEKITSHLMKGKWKIRLTACQFPLRSLKVK